MIDYPTLKIAFVLTPLIVLLFFIQRFVAGFFLRIFIRLLIISLMGTMIYSFYITQKGSLPSGSFEKAVEPYIPSPGPINRTIENVKKFEEDQKKKEEMLDSLKDSGGN